MTLIFENRKYHVKSNRLEKKLVKLVTMLIETVLSGDPLYLPNYLSYVSLCYLISLGSQPNQKPNPNKIYEDENSTDQVGIPMDPNSSNEEKNSTSSLLEKITETKSLRETEVIWHIGESYEHRSLLLHPVIDTFVELKWKMALSLYVRRIRFFWLFAVILTSEIFNQYEKKATTSDEFCILKKILFIILPMLLLIGNVLYSFFKQKWSWKRFQRYSFDWLLIFIFMVYVSVVSVHSLQNSHASEFGKWFILLVVWSMNLSRFLVTCFHGKFNWHSHWIMETLMMVLGKLQIKYFSSCLTYQKVEKANL